MTHYSDNPQHVRVDFFKEHGKWYSTEQMEWQGRWKAEGSPLIHDQFLSSLKNHLISLDGRLRMGGMWAVCLEPYHENAFPLMMKVPEFR